jgi:hypothetical protein
MGIEGTTLVFNFHLVRRADANHWEVRMAAGEMARSPGQSGRGMLGRSRLLIVFILVALMSVVMAPTTSAARAWCRTDPVVVIDGTMADVFVSGPLLAPLIVTGPTKMIIIVPEGVKTQMILSDLGFLHGYDYEFRQSSELQKTRKGVQVRIQVYVPASDSSMPVRVEFSPRVLGLLGLVGLSKADSAEGTANQWITLDTFLAYGLL